MQPLLYDRELINPFLWNQKQKKMYYLSYLSLAISLFAWGASIYITRKWLLRFAKYKRKQPNFPIMIYLAYPLLVLLIYVIGRVGGLFTGITFWVSGILVICIGYLSAPVMQYTDWRDITRPIPTMYRVGICVLLYLCIVLGTKLFQIVGDFLVLPLTTWC